MMLTSVFGSAAFCLLLRNLGGVSGAGEASGPGSAHPSLGIMEIHAPALRDSKTVPGFGVPC